MLSGIHILLTYSCTFKCNHCFLYCGPGAKGTFTLNRIRAVLDEAEKVGTVDTIYFEGGEPFLFYPLMLEGIKLARSKGFKAGIVTNAYFAVSGEDAELWLKPLRKLEIFNLSISDDEFHYAGQDRENTPPRRAEKAAKKMGIPVTVLRTVKPRVEETGLISGGIMFKGRAVENLVEGLPRKPWEELKECKHENLSAPKRMHVDPYGNVHLCQGLIMGNMWSRPLSRLVEEYDPASHPISSCLVQGGPALLSRQYNLKLEDNYVDECHFCFSLRLALLERFPQYLGPGQVYGVE